MGRGVGVRSEAPAGNTRCRILKVTQHSILNLYADALSLSNSVSRHTTYLKPVTKIFGARPRFGRIAHLCPNVRPRLSLTRLCLVIYKHTTLKYIALLLYIQIASNEKGLEELVRRLDLHATAMQMET